MTRLNIALLAFVTLVLVGCKPCGCSEATLISEEITLKITFDSSIFFFVDDKFTITVIQAGSVRTIKGTYEETKNTIKFDVDGAVPFLSVKSGEINALKCDDARGQFTVTPPAPAGGVSIPLTFQCTKK